MRDLSFRKLTSSDKMRKIISTSEIVDKQGVHSIVHRHFICFVKEVVNNQPAPPEPYVYVLKEQDNKKHKGRFFCKVRGSVYAVSNNKLFLLIFMHTLKINLATIKQKLVN